MLMVQTITLPSFFCFFLIIYQFIMDVIKSLKVRDFSLDFVLWLCSANHHEILWGNLLLLGLL